MKTFEEISKKCPFLFWGSKPHTYVCSARLSVTNAPFINYKLQLCSEEHCGLWYFITLKEEE